jgi:pimeloyl-ACP methyl ester carboxylesterase
MPGSLFAPFDAATGLSQQLLTLCHTWPGAGERFTPETDALPNVPALVTAGQQDTRTSLAGALAVAAQFPRARVLTVPNVGHSVVGTDTSECTNRQVVRFLELKSTGACRGPGRVPISGVPPRRVSALVPIPGTRGA